MNIGIHRLVADLATLAGEIRALKRIVGAPWTRPMAEEQRHLARLRRRATELCVLRARVRGKYHLARAPREGAWPGRTWDQEAWHAAIAMRTARDYALASDGPPIPIGDADAPSGATASGGGEGRAS